MVYPPSSPPKILPFMKIPAVFYKNTVDNFNPPAPAWFKDILEEDLICTMGNLIVQTAYSNIGNYNYMLSELQTKLFETSCSEAECVYSWMTSDIDIDKREGNESIYDEVLNNYFNHDMAIIGRWIEMLFHQLLFNMLAPILDVIFITMEQGYMVYAGDITISGNSAYLIMELEDVSYGESTITNTHMGANAELSPDNYPH